MESSDVVVTRLLTVVTCAAQAVESEVEESEKSGQSHQISPHTHESLGAGPASFLEIGATAISASAPSKLKLVIDSMVDVLGEALAKQKPGALDLPNLDLGAEQISKSAELGMKSGAESVASMIPKMIGPQSLITSQVDGLLISALSPQNEATSGEFQRDTQSPLVTFDFTKLKSSPDHEYYKQESELLNLMLETASENLKCAQEDSTRIKNDQARLMRLIKKLLNADHPIALKLREYVNEKLPPELAPHKWAAVASTLGTMINDDENVEQYFEDVYDSSDPIALIYEAIKNVL